MSNWLVYGISGLFAYLLGAVPFAYLIARAKGVDIRKVGSGNVGATNVFRAVGKGPGIATFVCDALKGLVPVLLCPVIASRSGAAFDRTVMGVVCTCFAVIGHTWPVYLKFKGGKGVATSTGALLGLAPAAMLIGLGIWVIVFAASRYVSLASIIAALAVGAAGWPLYHSRGLLLPVFLILLTALVIVRHRTNILRLMNGTEHRFARRA